MDDEVRAALLIVAGAVALTIFLVLYLAVVMPFIERNKPSNHYLWFTDFGATVLLFRWLWRKVRRR